MKIKKELLQKVEDIANITISDAEKWVELFQKIPISSSLQTTLLGLKKRENFLDCGDDNSFAEGMIFWLVVTLKEGITEEDDPDLATCNFYPNDRADIESYEEAQKVFWSGDDYAKLVEINFFGFSGTWEEVVRKIIEANNLLNPTVPKFNF